MTRNTNNNHNHIDRQENTLQFQPQPRPRRRTAPDLRTLLPLHFFARDTAMHESPFPGEYLSFANTSDHLDYSNLSRPSHTSMRNIKKPLPSDSFSSSVEKGMEVGNLQIAISYDMPNLTDGSQFSSLPPDGIQRCLNEDEDQDRDEDFHGDIPPSMLYQLDITGYRYTGDWILTALSELEHEVESGERFSLEQKEGEGDGQIFSCGCYQEYLTRLFLKRVGGGFACGNVEVEGECVVGCETETGIEIETEEEMRKKEIWLEAVVWEKLRRCRFGEGDE